MKCFYHGCDFDGHCSAAIVKMVYPKCELIPINYGDIFPWDTIRPKEKVFMVDFAIQPYDENMPRLKELADLVWIDHHKTSLEWAKNSNFICSGGTDLDFAGCELTWKYLHYSPIPLAVHLLGRYDIWKYEDDDRVLPFQYGMKLAAQPPTNTAWWSTLFGGYPTNVDDIIKIGKNILQYQEKINVEMCDSSAFDLDWEDLHWTALNGTFRGSTPHKKRWETGKYDAMLGFWWDGKQWIFSMTTAKNGVDVSKIAKKYGGGGHKQAAGCQMLSLPFLI
jgi:oligoribonuclease NrnB/cAMP/cGMP phosphodiesterase (DHH superfamily)